MFKCFLEWRCEFGFAVSIILEQGGKHVFPGQEEPQPWAGSLWLHTFLDCGEIWLPSRTPLVIAKTERSPPKMWQGAVSRCQQLGRWGNCWENSSSAGRQRPGGGCSFVVFLPETASWEPSLSSCLWNHVGSDCKAIAQTGARSETQKCHHALFIPPDKMYRKQI